MLNIFQDVPTVNDIADLASGQNYTVAGVLLLVCIYLGWAKWDASKRYQKTIDEKDTQIDKVQKEHKDDLKAYNSDYKSIVDKYYQFVSTVNFNRNG